MTRCPGWNNLGREQSAPVLLTFLAQRLPKEFSRNGIAPMNIKENLNTDLKNTRMSKTGYIYANRFSSSDLLLKCFYSSEKLCCELTVINIITLYSIEAFLVSSFFRS